MDISVNQLLKKIESELHKSKRAESASKLRESVHSIKILCELILEENDKDSMRSLAGSTSPQPASVVTATSLSSKKLEMEEEANGDSLFDF